MDELGKKAFLSEHLAAACQSSRRPSSIIYFQLTEEPKLSLPQNAGQESSSSYFSGSLSVCVYLHKTSDLGHFLSPALLRLVLSEN